MAANSGYLAWNSIDSPFVRQEWEHACGLGRQNFIRPVYWEEPLPSRPERGLPPPELRRLHFQRLALGAVDWRAAAARERRELSRIPGQVARRRSGRIGEAIAQLTDRLTKAAHGRVPADAGAAMSENESKRDVEATPTAAPKSIPAAAHHKLERVRKPRCHISYETAGAQKTVRGELPFVIGVMADFSGHSDTAESVPAEHRSARGPVGDRQFLEIDRDSYDNCMKAIGPRLALVVPDTLKGEGKLYVDLRFECMEAFTPAAIAGQIDETRRLLKIREQLTDLSTADHPRASDEPRLERLLEDFGLPSDDPDVPIERIIGNIDAKLSEQLQLILHHPAFQQLEATWRGLHHLVFNTETSESLKIRVLNISKHDLGRVLSQGVEWDQTPIYAMICLQDYAQLGGPPYGCLVGDYYFDHQPADLRMLADLAGIAAASHTPFITGANPSLLGMGSWQELPSPRNLGRILSGPKYTVWQHFRDAEESRFMGAVTCLTLALVLVAVYRDLYKAGRRFPS